MTCDLDIPEQTTLVALPFPAVNANKYTRGKLVVVAGCAEYPGAACLAATAGQRAGAGYVEVLCAASTVPIVQAYRPSLVARSWEHIENRTLPASEHAKPVAYVVGPGFNANEPECQKVALFVLEHAQAPVLVDGGALGIIASPAGRALVRTRHEKGLVTTLTPHEGEAARLMRAAEEPVASAQTESATRKQAASAQNVREQTAERRQSTSCEQNIHAETFRVQASPQTAQLLSRAYKAIVAVKGANTFVSDGTHSAAITKGTPALAKAGTGDVLAGMAGAYLAQGIDPFVSLVSACALHAEAGVQAEKTLTSISVTPEDVIDHIPAAIKELMRTNETR